MMRQWKHDNYLERGAICLDCEIPYPFPVEMIIADEQWEAISPTNERGCGLLCHRCMIERLREKGITRVDVRTFIVVPQDEIGIPDYGDSNHE